MRLKKNLHPEIICNLRGDEFLREFYKDSFKLISFDHKDEQTFGFYFKSEALAKLDENMVEHMAITWKFRSEYNTKNKPKVFHLGKEFTQALIKYEKDIPIDMLPERFFGYISFPDATVFDEQDEIQGAYIYIGSSNEAPVNPDQRNKRVLWISYVCKDNVAARSKVQILNLGDHNAIFNFLSVGRLLISATDGTLSQLLKETPNFDFCYTGLQKKADISSRNKVFRLLVNTVLYINSVDPDLETAFSHVGLSNSQKSKISQSGKAVNECMMPVTLVHQNYHKERSYHVDSTWVDTHLRWQRCGIGLSQIKLVWVSAHERKFDSISKERPQP